jgi:hypothetical protein
LDSKHAIKDIGHRITCLCKAGTRLKLAEVAPAHQNEAKMYANADGDRPLVSMNSIRRDAGLNFETEFPEKRNSYILQVAVCLDSNESMLWRMRIVKPFQLYVGEDLKTKISDIDGSGFSQGGASTKSTPCDSGAN